MMCCHHKAPPSATTARALLTAMLEAQRHGYNDTERFAVIEQVVESIAWGGGFMRLIRRHWSHRWCVNMQVGIVYLLRSSRTHI
jgi:hypothetical protein